MLLYNGEPSVLEPPYRSPLAVIEAIKDIIKDKVVCDLGCAYGDLMIEMQKYAKEVIGVEVHDEAAKGAINRGLNVIEGDMYKIDIPQADVYYLWISIPDWDLPKIPKLLKKGIWIIAADTSIKEEEVTLSIISLCKLEENRIDVPYNEGIKLRENGTLRLFITEVK